MTEFFIGNIKGPRGDPGKAPRIGSGGTWETWDNTASLWLDSEVEARGPAADITGQSLYEYSLDNGFSGSYDDWLREYLIRKTDDTPWVSGYFQSRSITTSGATLTPVATDGLLSMVQGNNIVVPKDGIYLISGGGGSLSTGTLRNNFSIASFSPTHTGNAASTTVMMPYIGGFRVLKTGESFTAGFSPSATTTLSNAKFFVIMAKEFSLPDET